MNLGRLLRAALIPLATVTVMAVPATLDAAHAAGTLSVSKATLSGQQLTVVGSGAATGFLAVRSSTSAAGVRVFQDGKFTVKASGFTAPDCKVVVQDYKSNLLTVTLSGCTPTTSPVTPPAGPSGTCVITTPAGPSNLAVNKSGVVWFDTTGCNTRADGGITPTQNSWKLVSGAVPTGMTSPAASGTTSGNIIGTPTVPGTYKFTVQVTDSAGQTDQESYTVIVS
jgi:putative Ig domain-containing protein